MKRKTPMVPPQTPSNGLTRAPHGAHSQTERSFSTGKAGRKDEFDIFPPQGRNSARQDEGRFVCRFATRRVSK